MLINVQNRTRAQRVNRTPSFPIAGVMAPYGLYPIWAHPVLPGETLQTVTQKQRVISLPIKHPMVGAWLESWLVYVKFSDLDRDLGEMFIKDTVSSTAYEASADNARYFVKDGQIDWVRLCVEKVHSSYFLDEGETARAIDGVPMVKLNNASWYQNMTFDAADATVPTADAGDMYQHLKGWAMLQQMQMTELTYEKYLETYGVRPNAANDGDPEILRFARSWTQPVNTVEPSTGTPSSAFVWSDEIKADKPKRFTEPGFILMLQAVRPKMYTGGLSSSLIGKLWGFSDWFPSYNLDDPTAGVKELAKTDDIFAAAITDAGTETLLYDHRDLLSHGEQFINSATHPYDLPTANGFNVKTGAATQDLRGQYPLEADLEALFVGESITDPARLYYEGIALATLSGHVREDTPAR